MADAKCSLPLYVILHKTSRKLSAKWKNTKLKRYSKNLCLFLLFFFTLTACQQNRQPSFEVIGKVSLDESEKPYAFSDTLNALYTTDGQVVVATIDNILGKRVEISIDEVILGDFVEGDRHIVNWQIDSQAIYAPEIGRRYLFFIRKNGSEYALQLDDNGWLSVENGRVFTSRTGASISLETVEFESARVGNAVVLPANFYYFWDLDQLVANCDNIFKGTVRNYREASYTFYANDSEMRINLSDDAHVYQLEVEEVYHGSLHNGDSVQVISAPVMMKNTVDYTSQQPTGQKYSNAPPLFVDATYIFFIIDSPVSELTSTNFFVNPVQGMVPFSPHDQLTYIVPANPVFAATTYNEEDLIYDIRYFANEAAQMEQ